MSDQYKNQIRHTLPTLAGIEDCLAIMIDILNEVEQHQVYIDARLIQMNHILQKMREGPYAYDPETPAGRRDACNGCETKETQNRTD